MAQQARNLCTFFDELPDRPRYIVCDRDSKFTRQFREILKGDDVKVVQTAVRAPNQNTYAERWAQSLRRECLDHFIVFGEKHLRYLVQEYVRYYNEARPHQSKENLPPSMVKPPDPIDSLGPEDVVCREWVGGLLKHHQRKAA